MTFSLKASADGLSGSLQVGGVDVVRFGGDTSGQPFGFRNILINADFRINQRAYASAAVLAAGAYGHDRWKAGASGGDYTFTQLPSSTTVTIASGKTLIQVVEDKNVGGGSYILSWTGTAQARVGLNSATPSGAYAASPILITGQNAGTVLSVEFNTGTLGKVQLEEGSIATKFERRLIGFEIDLCKRYLPIINIGAFGSGYFANATSGVIFTPFQVQPRVIPTGITTAGSVVTNSALGTISVSVTFNGSTGLSGAYINCTGAGFTAGQAFGVVLSGAPIFFTGCEL